MDFLREWFLGMAGAAMVGVFALAVTPQGTVKRVVQMAAALVFILSVLHPLTGVSEFSSAGLQLESLPASAEIEIGNSTTELLSLFIAEQTSAYIVSKAQALGLDVSVTAYCRLGEFYPEPWSVTILHERPEHARSALRKLIE